MKKKLFLITLFFSLHSTTHCQLQVDTSLSKVLSPAGDSNPNKIFKNFTAKSADGNTYTTANLKNKITFINFWMEACAPCIAEFEPLNSLYIKYKKDSNFQFLSFTFETTETILRISEKYKLKYPILLVERDSIYNLIFNLGFPTNMITDKSGKICFIVSGGFNEIENAQKVVDTIFSKEIERQLLRAD